MNRTLFTLFCAVLVAAGAFAQSNNIGICNQIISPFGLSATKQGVNWAFTVGEPVILTFKSASLNRTLTQGFHQPDLCRSTSIRATDLSDWQIDVFPNPTADFIYIRYNAPQRGQALRVTVRDLLGRPLPAIPASSPVEGLLLDATGWPPGIYLLHLQDPRSRAQTTFRLVKV